MLNLFRVAKRNHKSWYPSLYFGIQLLKIWYPATKKNWQPWTDVFSLSATTSIMLDFVEDGRDFDCLPQLRELMQQNITVVLPYL